MCQSSFIKIVSLLFCDLNRVASRNAVQTNILVRSSFQNSEIETLNSYSRSTYVNVNMCFSNSNFEGNFSTYVFGEAF